MRVTVDITTDVRSFWRRSGNGRISMCDAFFVSAYIDFDLLTIGIKRRYLCRWQDWVLRMTGIEWPLLCPRLVFSFSYHGEEVLTSCSHTSLPSKRLSVRCTRRACSTEPIDLSIGVCTLTQHFRIWRYVLVLTENAVAVAHTRRNRSTRKS